MNTLNPNERKLSIQDYLNPEIELTLAEHLILRNAFIEVHEKEYELAKDYFDAVDQIYWQVIIHPILDKFDDFKVFLEEFTELANRSTATVKEDSIAMLLYKRATFLLWQIKERQ